MWHVDYIDNGLLKSEEFDEGQDAATHVGAFVALLVQAKCESIEVKLNPRAASPADPPKYPAIAQLVNEGKVVLFLGSGATRSSRLPPNGAFKFTVGTNRANHLPTGEELAKLLSDLSSYPVMSPYDCGDLARVASYYSQSEVPTEVPLSLTSLIDGVFADDSFRPGSIHRAIAQIAKSGKPLLIVTTNYDTLIEDALDTANVSYDLIVHDTLDENANSVLIMTANGFEQAADSRNLDLQIGARTVVYKMHGSVGTNPSRFVITEEDYVKFMTRMGYGDRSVVPPQLTAAFQEKHFLFLGYSLRDWNLRILLENLHRCLPAPGPKSQNSDALATFSARPVERTSHWAVQHAPTIVDKELWEKRGVKIYKEDLDRFANLLLQRLGLPLV